MSTTFQNVLEEKEDFMDLGSSTTPTQETKQDRKSAKSQATPPFKFTRELWSVFDKIVCLTQNAKPNEKFGSMAQELDLYPVEYVHNENKHANDVTSKARSTFENYVTIIREALQDKQLRNMLILTDDINVAFHPTPNRAREMTHFVDIRHYDVFMLGAVPDIFFDHPVAVSGMKHIFKLNTSTACAYVLSRRFMEHVATLEYDTFRAPIEKVFATNQECYAILEPWFTPHNESNNFMPISFRALPNAFKGWFAANSNAPLIVYAVIGAILILFLLCFLLLK